MARQRNGADAVPEAPWATPSPRPGPTRRLAGAWADLRAARRARWSHRPRTTGPGPEPSPGLLRAVAEWTHARPGRAWASTGIELVVGGADRLPTGGGLVLVVNHQHPRDVGLVHAALPSGLARRTRPLAPAAVRALARLPWPAAGTGVLLVFGDGAPSQDGTVGPFDPAVVTLARRRRAALVPVAVRGSFVLPHGRSRCAGTSGSGAPRVAVRFGTPLVPGGEAPEAVAAGLRESVLELLAEDAGTWWRQRRGVLPPSSPGAGWRQVWAATASTADGTGHRRRRIWR